MILDGKIFCTDKIIYVKNGIGHNFNMVISVFNIKIVYVICYEDSQEHSLRAYFVCYIFYIYVAMTHGRRFSFFCEIVWPCWGYDWVS